MFKYSIAFGIALIVVGIGGYIVTDMQSPTALIPAALGILLLIAGFVARNPNLRKHAMHVAALVGLIGIGGTAKGAIALFSGAELARPAATISQAITFVLCLGFVILCVKSFIDARVLRKSGQS